MSSLESISSHIQIVLQECRDQIPGIGLERLQDILQSMQKTLEKCEFPITRLELRRQMMKSMNSQTAPPCVQEIIDICFPSSLGPFSIWPRKDSQAIQPIHSDIPKKFDLKQIDTKKQELKSFKSDPLEYYSLHQPKIKPTKKKQELYEMIRDFPREPCVPPSAERLALENSKPEPVEKQESSNEDGSRNLISFQEPEIPTKPTHFSISDSFSLIFNKPLQSLKASIYNCQNQNGVILCPIIFGSLYQESLAFVDSVMKECGLTEIKMLSSHSYSREAVKPAFKVMQPLDIHQVLKDVQNQSIVLFWICEFQPCISSFFHNCTRLSPVHIHPLTFEQRQDIWHSFWENQSEQVKSNQDFILKRSFLFGFHAFINLLEALDETDTWTDLQEFLEQVAWKHDLLLCGENLCFKLNEIWQKSAHVTPFETLSHITLQEVPKSIAHGLTLATEKNFALFYILNMRFMLDGGLVSQESIIQRIHSILYSCIASQGAFVLLDTRILTHSSQSILIEAWTDLLQKHSHVQLLFIH